MRTTSESDNNAMMNHVYTGALAGAAVGATLGASVLGLMTFFKKRAWWWWWWGALYVLGAASSDATAEPRLAQGFMFLRLPQKVAIFICASLVLAGKWAEVLIITTCLFQRSRRRLA